MHKQNTKRSGFTIVELIIVIVVIAILASISIVSYMGIANRAKTAKAQMHAKGVEDVANAYYAFNGAYPTSVSQFTSAVIALPTGTDILLNAGNLGPDNGENSVVYKYVLTGSVATGACIYYWSFIPIEGTRDWDGAPAAGEPGRSKPVYLGTANHSNCSASAAKGNGPSP